MQSHLNMKESEIAQLNPQVLAFVGDSVYSLYIRQQLLNLPQNKSNVLHTIANKYVSAVGQSVSMEKLLPILDDVEMAIFKRARNYHTASSAKNSSISEYRRATGLEAVVGFLYLSHKEERLEKVLKLCKEAVDEG